MNAERLARSEVWVNREHAIKEAIDFYNENVEKVMGQKAAQWQTLWRVAAAAASPGELEKSISDRLVVGSKRWEEMSEEERKRLEDSPVSRWDEGLKKKLLMALSAVRKSAEDVELGQVWRTAVGEDEGWKSLGELVRQKAFVEALVTKVWTEGKRREER